MLREILSGLLFDIHRIACLRGVSVNFKFLSILSQTAKWTFPVLVVFSKICGLVRKLNHEWRNNSESLLEPLCCLAFWDRLLSDFFYNKFMFVFILYSQTMEFCIPIWSNFIRLYNPEIKRSIPWLTFWYDFLPSSGKKKTKQNKTEEIDR